MSSITDLHIGKNELIKNIYVTIAQLDTKEKNMFHKRPLRYAIQGICILILLLSVNAGAPQLASAASAPATLPFCSSLTSFDTKNFSNPLIINNKYSPLVPGTQYTLEGTTIEGTHTVVLVVTDLTKVIDGVRTRVLWDRDFQDGALTESELAFQAQDDQANVWVLGEYPEEYDDKGKFVGAPSTWISGIDQAEAGVLVPGRPRVGSDPFLEGKSPSIDFYDCGQVSSISEKVSVPTGNYKNVLLVNEWAPLEQDGGIQLKYYAPGVGNVQIGALNDPEAEILTLQSIVQLSPAAMLDVRQEALKMDKRGHRISDVYSQTAPLE
jgi:hypothetical protein